MKAKSNAGSGVGRARDVAAALAGVDERLGLGREGAD